MCPAVVSVEPVYLERYDLLWPLSFDEERARVLDALGTSVESVEHVGSTAISGLDSKPVIDLMVGLKSMAGADSCVGPLVYIGYSYWEEGVEPHHRLFVRFVDREMPARTYNLHLVEAGGRYWQERLLFRDYLCENPETARAYARLKHELADRHREDREAYTAAKSEFVSEVVNFARRES